MLLSVYQPVLFYVATFLIICQFLFTFFFSCFCSFKTFVFCCLTTPTPFYIFVVCVFITLPLFLSKLCERWRGKVCECLFWHFCCCFLVAGYVCFHFLACLFAYLTCKMNVLFRSLKFNKTPKKHVNILEQLLSKIKEKIYGFKKCIIHIL